MQKYLNGKHRFLGKRKTDFIGPYTVNFLSICSWLELTLLVLDLNDNQPQNNTVYSNKIKYWVARSVCIHIHVSVSDLKNRNETLNSLTPQENFKSHK